MAGRSGVKLPPLSARPLGWVFPRGHQQPVPLEAHRGQGWGALPQLRPWGSRATAAVRRQASGLRHAWRAGSAGGPASPRLSLREEAPPGPAHSCGAAPLSPGFPGNQGRWEKPLTAGQSHSPGQPCPPWTVSQETPPSGGC